MELGWIDFSKTERSKILSVLDLLSESGTLDELGIAPVRDGFSNLFFPGTTTIQTRAKYFFIVPYALKQLERSSETNPNRVFKALDAIEKTCGQTFLEQNHTDYMLFTRAMSLGKLNVEDCRNFRIFTMKDAVVDGESAISEDEPQVQKQDIHAKVYMVRKNSDSYLYLGSLNASHNAMFGNIEFMMLLKSKNR